jgi:radical SAM protein with 4Fe4S-binding SPASM domain
MMFPCVLARRYGYDLRRGDFQTGWQTSMKAVREIPAPAGYKCSQCELLGLCGQCPGWAELEEDGGEVKRVDYLCRIAHERARILNVPEMARV